MNLLTDKSDFDTIRDAWTDIIVEHDEAVSAIEDAAGPVRFRSKKQATEIMAAKDAAQQRCNAAHEALPALHGWTAVDFDAAMDEETERMNALTD
jgi:Xaa-Pro aminopeptidase